MKRVGLIIPSSNRHVEEDLVPRFPAGVHGHVARLRMTGPHHVPLDRLLPRITEAAATLADARCDAIVFHCTATAMEEGRSGEERILAALRAATSNAVLTTAGAVRDALAALTARRIVLVTPYDAATNEAEAAYLRGDGVEVVRSVATDLGGSDAYYAATTEYWIETAAAGDDPRADAFFLSCANTRTLDAIGPLEARLGRPVISSNQCVLWASLAAVGAPVSAAPGRLAAA